MLLNVVIHKILLVGLASGCQRCSAAASTTPQMLGWYSVAKVSLNILSHRVQITGNSCVVVVFFCSFDSVSEVASHDKVYVRYCFYWNCSIKNFQITKLSFHPSRLPFISSGHLSPLKPQTVELSMSCCKSNELIESGIEPRSARTTTGQVIAPCTLFDRIHHILLLQLLCNVGQCVY